MAYQKLNLPNGIPFNADHVAHMEQGIADAHDKHIVGVKDGDNWEFSKTPAEIFALGEDVLNYEVVLIVGREKFVCFGIDPTSTDSERIGLNFYRPTNGSVSKYTVKFYANNTIEVSGRSIAYFYDIPNPTGKNGKYLSVLNSSYILVDPPEIPTYEDLNIPMLTAALMNGILIPQTDMTLPGLVQRMMQLGHGNINLVVIVPTNDGSGYESATIYRMVKIENITDTVNMYAIFTNGIDKNIKMDVSGNFTYMD